MGTYAYDATNDTLDLIAGRGNTDALAAKLSKTSDNIAPKQDTNTASELIPVGKYFINANGDLCQCDVQIASGGSIITGTNCHVIQDGGINELNSNFITKKYGCPEITLPSTSHTVSSAIDASVDGYTPVCCTLEHVGHASQYTVVPALFDGNVYLLFVRIHSSSYIVDPDDVTVLVLYIKS